MIVVEGRSFKYRRIGSVSVSHGYVGLHAHLVKNAKFVVEVIISATILIIFFVHFFECGQGVPITVSWFVVEPVPLSWSEISEIFCVPVVVLKICLGVPSVAPLPVLCPGIVWRFCL